MFVSLFAHSQNVARIHFFSQYFRSTDLFNKIASSCFSKCASAKHREPDLSLGEMTCADRCVSKYLESQERVGAVLQRANEAQLAQQQSLTDMQRQMGDGGK